MGNFKIHLPGSRVILSMK